MIQAKTKREFYDRFCRDPEIKRFYHSAQWQKVKTMKLNRAPCCETCAQAGRDAVPADLCHHSLKITTPEGWAHRLDMDFLVSVCHSCHNQIEGEMDREEIERERNEGVV